MARGKWGKALSPMATPGGGGGGGLCGGETGASWTTGSNGDASPGRNGPWEGGAEAGTAPPPPTWPQGGKAQNLRPTALTPAREAGTWNCLEHEQGQWPDEHVMN